MKKSARMFLFFAVCFVFNMATGFAHPVTPTLFKQLELASYMFGVALAGQLLTNFLFSPFWGKITTYISSRNTLLICTLGYAVGQVFFLLARDEWGIMGARVFAGVFCGGVFVAMSTYIVNGTADPWERGKQLTANATIQAIGATFGYFAGGLLGEISVEAAIIAQIAVLAAMGVAFRLVCEKDDQADIATLKGREMLRAADPFRALADSGKFLTPILCALFGMCVLQNLAYNAFDQSFNYYLKDVFSFSSGYNGIIKGAMGVITLVANSTICLWMMRRGKLRRDTALVLGLCAVSLASVLLFTEPLPFIVANVVYYAFNSVSMPLLQNLAAERARGADSNLVMGFYNAVRSLGGVVGATASGLLYTLNPRYPFALGALVFVGATVCGVIYARAQKKEKTDAA